ncbi:MAG: hypothetical protein QOF20_2293 [Acidimicrobiaceae bacterium]|nr:hypothetical protein [Acidimicrobiaceae bacterium]
MTTPLLTTRSQVSLVSSVRGVVARGAAVTARLRDAGWRQTRIRLFDLEFDAEIADVRQRLERARMRKHHHDLVNAFTAVEGAALIMTRETLTAADRSMLNSLLGSGLTRLRELLVAGVGENHVALGDLAMSLAQDPGWCGRVKVDVGPDMAVTGSPGEIGEAVRQLLIFAVGRDPSSPVEVHGHRNGDRVELWIEDRGRQFSTRERTAILEPRCPRWFPPGHGLGLSRGARSRARRVGAVGPSGGTAAPLGGVGPSGGLLGLLGPQGAPSGAGAPVGPGGPVDAAGPLGPLGSLHVAVRLARGQGGDVKVVARPGGGESFRVSWEAHVG